jgi:hypothetical protein
VGGAAVGIEVMFPRGHDFAAQDSILTRPFARLRGGPPVAPGDKH